MEKFGIPRRQAWGTGHCVRVAANGKAGENDDQGVQVEGESQFGEGVGGALEIWQEYQRSLCTVSVFLIMHAIDRAPTRRSRTSMAGMGDKKL